MKEKIKTHFTTSVQLELRHFLSNNIMKLKQMILTILIAIIFFSNMLYGQDVEVITIDPYLSFENYEHFKRLTLSSPDSSIDFIEGFEFLWGYSYKLEVKQTKLDHILSDGTKFRYSLEKIISKTKVHDTVQFKLLLDGNRYYYEVDSSEQEFNKTFNKINDSTFLYLDQVEIEVPLTLTDEMNRILENKVKKIGTFTYVHEKRNRIRLVHL